MTQPLPRFRTPRLLLRPRTADDLDACVAMDRDPEVARFVDGPWNDPKAHRAFVAARIGYAFPPGMGYWSILAPGLVGWILLTPLDLHGPEIEIGWRVAREARGRGYAAEAARPVLDHALRTLRLPEVVADIDPENLPSLAVARRLGLRPVRPVPYAGRMVTRFVARAGGLS